ncbi:DUF7563 family protein [Haloglomus salinum]
MNCNNCGSHVSQDYVRVFSTDNSVDVCPHCEDRLRSGDGVNFREYRGQ